jgi:SAM-dependent methyltransferase
VEYDPTQYLGAAPYYLRGRPGYSADLPSVLADELGLDGTGHLVDVGSGPGIVGVQLGRLFGHVTLLEPDPDMLAEARSHAAAAGLRSVDFVRATAEDLPELGLSPVRVVTFGQSFHRTNRLVVAETVYQLLEPGGSLVLIGHDPTRPAPPAPAATSPIPHEQIRELITTFLNSELRSGNRPVADYSVERFEQTLQRTSFGTPRTVFASGRADITRDADGVLAGCLSMVLRRPALVRSTPGRVHRRTTRAA